MADATQNQTTENQTQDNTTQGTPTEANYQYYDIPKDLRDKAETFYGTTGYPPVDNTGKWKLLASSTTDTPTFMIENSDNAGIFMVTDTLDFRDRANIKTDFTDKKAQLILVGNKQKLLFSKTGYHLYKLITNDAYDKDNNIITEIKVSIIQ